MKEKSQNITIKNEKLTAMLAFLPKTAYLCSGF